MTHLFRDWEPLSMLLMAAHFLHSFLSSLPGAATIPYPHSSFGGIFWETLDKTENRQAPLTRRKNALA